ncbi:MAG TPA: hypothetical protein GXX38_04750 [Clostridia bacterium]|jgi:glutamate racemase|nr:hypothetical protein [Clostridia bacterium]
MGIVGVIAGTPVDTRMGVDFLTKKGLVAKGRSSSSTPEEQTKMQTLSPLELTQQVIGLSFELINEGADKILLYCNSLSGAIDLSKLRKTVAVPVITPLDVYADLAQKYQKLAVLAANCQSLAAIERTFQQANPNCLVFGAGILPVVIAIENEVPSRLLVNRYGLKQLVEGFVKMGAEALVLGCTHFPYLAGELARICPVELIEPSEKMAEMLIG